MPSWRSTSGRAPSINSTTRFCRRAVSLNRPPTLLTISSLLSASIIGKEDCSEKCSFWQLCRRPAGGRLAGSRGRFGCLNAAGPLKTDDFDDFFDGLFQVVIDDHVV